MSDYHPNSPIHRRSFLRTGAFAAGALFAGGRLIAAGTAGTADSTAHRFIAKYSDHFFSRSGGAGLTRFVAHVRDLPSFSEALFHAREAGISHLRVAGTVATFRADGRTFEVENRMDGHAAV